MLNLQAMLNKVSKQQRIYEAKVNFGCSTLQKNKTKRIFYATFSLKWHMTCTKRQLKHIKSNSILLANENKTKRIFCTDKAQRLGTYGLQSNTCKT